VTPLGLVRNPYRWAILAGALGALLAAYLHRAAPHHVLAPLVTLVATLLVCLYLWNVVRHELHQTGLMEQLRESGARFRQLAENIDSVFWVNSPDWRRVHYVSPAYERIWGRAAAELYGDGMAWFEAVVEEDRAGVMTKIRDASGADWQGIEFPPYRILRPDGAVRWIAARAFPIRDEAGRITRVAGIAEDITDQQAHRQRLEELAHYDALTHLPNRLLLADRMAQALARSRRTGQLLAICLLDLDGFKPVNDRLGHEAGDHLLVQVAQRLREGMRADDSVARLGGDEFVLLLGGLASVREVEEALERMLTLIARTPCCATPTTPCTWPSRGARTASTCSARYWSTGSGRTGRPWPTSPGPWTGTNCSCISSPSLTAGRGRSSPWRPCCAGGTPSWGCSGRRNS